MSQPLASWNDTPTRQAIVDFVMRVTDADGPGFVSVPERVATFDADGTLWCEKPVGIQIVWILQRLADRAAQDSSLRTKQPFKAAYEKDDAWFNNAITTHYNGDDSAMKVLVGGVAEAFSSMTVESFVEQAAHFFDTEQHPVYKVPYTAMTFQPMVELLDYLAANDFTTYIVSGGGRDFMRPVAPELFGIPPERVIGSASAMSFKSDEDGAHVMRGESVALIDDGPAKAIQIWDRIGRRPILAAGNANGDVPMLEYADVSGSKREPLRLIVNHNDGDRETSYTAGAEKLMKVAGDRNWSVINMAADWKRVFSFQ